MVGVSSGGRIGPFGTLFACGSIGGKSDAELLELFASGEAAEAAFEVLVARHGPAVLRACRRVLSDPNDADDAFQATFLVLARRVSSGSIGRPDPLGPWLHGVALRVARKTRVVTARRRRHEAKVAGRPDAGGSRADDLAVAVREEVERLPEPLRSPVVLCYLEEMTYQGAARQLRVSEGTIRGRLVKARSVLRTRLGRREDVSQAVRSNGPTLGADPPRVAPTLAATTIRAALAFAPGGAGIASIPAVVAELMKGVMMITFVTRGIIGVLGLAAVCLVADGGAALTAKGDDRPSASKAIAPGQEPRKVEARPNQPPDSIPARVLTLDDAIARLLLGSLDLRSKFAEIPVARADVLMAGLRSSRPAPPPQFDLNIRQPLDISHKRRARPRSASVPGTVLEAQYQDAIRNRIDDLYKLYIDVQAAQELARRAKADSAWWDRLREQARRWGEEGRGPACDIVPIESARDRAGYRLRDARAELVRKRKALGSLLELPADQAGDLEVEKLRLSAPTIPTGESLERLALDNRPDLAALRLALKVMQVAVAEASKRARGYGDFYLLQQPYSVQGQTDAGRKTATSWALGVTVPLPISNRNHGDVSRGGINIHQTQVQLAGLERQVSSEVADRLRELASAQASLQQRSTRISVRRAFREDERRYEAGEGQADDAVRSCGDLERAELIYLQALARYRRSLLALNTALGVRLFP